MFLCCNPQRNRTCWIVGYTTKDSFAVWDTKKRKENCSNMRETAKKFQENSSNILRVFCGVSHTGVKPFPLYPALEKHSFAVSHNGSVVSHTGKKLKT
jgi:membrane peptidoglycan carboxypeptidase